MKDNLLDDKVILVTGGTGSFGNKFIEMVFEKYNPKKVIIYSRDEYKQSLMKTKLENISFVDMKRVRFFIGDVRDKERLYRAFKGVDFVVHAAAMKQVPTCEYNPFEAIKTNINGAQNVIEAALDSDVQKVVALSTDKAVNPCNLYGGTKLVSDKLFLSANAYSGEKDIRFSVVRYGNVAGSRGSVIPFFREILNSGSKELPITDINMTRFWITLEQGVELVFKAIEESVGGETYISKIPSFKIVDLAKAMDKDCVIKEIGIREGEKLSEIMITKEDARRTYEYKNHYIIYPDYDWKNIKQYNLNENDKVEEDFEYSSDNNDEWLDIEKLKILINKII